MRGWDARRVAAAADAELAAAPFAGESGREGMPGPRRVVIDSREVVAGDLFVGLAGSRVDGGDYAAAALTAGAWGVIVTPVHARTLVQASGLGAVLAHPDPLAALGRLAGAWRTELGARVVGITGSTGKTSTKDILAALLRNRLHTVSSSANLNTEIGLPLTILGAPSGTKVLVLEMAMRGPGQIAELAAIARPDVGVIVNVGPVHLQQLGSIENVAAAKAELLAALSTGATAVIPAAEPLLEPYRRSDLNVVTFGPSGDVTLADVHADGEVLIATPTQRIALRPSFSQRHNLENLLAATAAALALGVVPEGELDVAFSALRGERVALAGEVLVINDCYNANPMSMRAALDDLAATALGRRVAVLGDMLELGDGELALHREIGEYAAAQDVALMITVGPRAAAMRDGAAADAAVEVHAAEDAVVAARLLLTLLRDGDTVLVKASRGMHLEVVADALVAARAPALAGGID
jgi:UDP-N-acetylmuramoyl-tripeptide--D-alanyl-D-alanine ligase